MKFKNMTGESVINYQPKDEKIVGGLIRYYV